MGTFIFLAAVVVEIGFSAFCIITKSNQKKVKSMIRIVAFIVLVLFTVLPVIDWSFRYFALAALFLLLALLGAIDLIRTKEDRKEYKAVRIVLKAIGMTVLIFTLTLPAILFPEYKALKTTGEFQVATKTYTYTDSKRVETYTDTGENRKLNVQLWYPENAEGTYPLVVFSHGGFGIKSSNESLYNELASHGYVVCAINHTFQALYTTDKNGHTTTIDRGFMRETSEENAHTKKQQSYEYYQKWMKIRMGDINFVIDHILAETEKNEANMVYKLVDPSKIGVMGHSMGGSAALGIGRIREDVSAVMALESPFMYDIKGVKDAKFVFTDEKYPVPVLNVYSDTSWSHLDEWTQYAENYALLSNANSTAFNVHIRGVGHFNLTDLALTSPILTRIFNGKKSTTDTEYCLETINQISLEFFDCYLKGEGEFTTDGAD